MHFTVHCEASCAFN